jgi:DNA-binding protein H-NS
MARSYDGIVSQIQNLQREARKLKKLRTAAIREVRRLVAKFGISSEEIGATKATRRSRPLKRGPKGQANARSRGKVKTKRTNGPKLRYRGPNGEAWSGRGRRPAWLNEAIASGKSKDDFAR